MAPPIYVKGGVWTNVEDQILKAAVSKYGLTQWSRVASLLPKKTAKQAKARWSEYLSPAINRSSWTRDDDEKLLGLAKLLPNQWRSIALIMGRTATHCVERYQKLLEDAAKNEGENGDSEDEDEEMAEMKLTGPGIESLPALGNAFESLPSRPDAEDMEDDEREMLSEAKARLANTQGKKAKRKDRERMLDESKRVALLQKRRELKAAGINVSLTLKNKARRKEFDYNADIPHERQPKPGLYDVSGEDDLNEESRAKFQKSVNYKGIPSKDAGAKDAAKNKQAAEKDTKRIKAHTRLAAEAVAGIDADQQAKRRKLELPMPGTSAIIEEDAIKQRILAKSKDLLAAQTIAAGGSISPNTEPAFEKKNLVKVSRKKVAGALRALLDKVPQPREKTQLVVPRFDPHEDSLAVASVPESAHISQLDLLKQVDEEKAHSRRSEIIERGLLIPRPDAIDSMDSLDGQKSPLIEDIRREFRTLVKYDLEEDMVSVPLPLNEDIEAKIEAQIEKELGEISSKTLNENLPPLEPLPKLPEAISKSFDLLYALDASANESDQRQAVLEDTNASRKVNEKLIYEIATNAQELLQVDIEERVLLNIVWSEEAAIERRSAVIHELVEDIKAAENRAARQGVF